MQHSGGIPGFSTLVAFAPSRNLGVVILSNADEKAVWNIKIFTRILDDVLGTQTSKTLDARYLLSHHLYCSVL